jgi:hypothetical protein
MACVYAPLIITASGCLGFEDDLPGWFCLRHGTHWVGTGRACGTEWTCENNAPSHIGMDGPEGRVFAYELDCGAWGVADTAQEVDDGQNCRCLLDERPAGVFPMEDVCQLITQDAPDSFRRIVDLADARCGWETPWTKDAAQ